MTDVVTVYHIYPKGYCDEFRYVLTNEIPNTDTKGITIIYEEKSPKTHKYQAKDEISFDLEEAVLLHKLLGKLLTGES